MTRETGIRVAAYIIVIVVMGIVIAAALWLAMSAVDSFVEMGWRSITSTPRGRAIIGVVWLWLMASNVACLFDGPNTKD